MSRRVLIRLLGISLGAILWAATSWTSNNIALAGWCPIQHAGTNCASVDDIMPNEVQIWGYCWYPTVKINVNFYTFPVNRQGKWADAFRFNAMAAWNAKYRAYFGHDLFEESGSGGDVKITNLDEDTYVDRFGDDSDAIMKNPMEKEEECCGKLCQLRPRYVYIRNAANGSVWQYNSTSGYFRNVAAHEFGHLIRLIDVGSTFGSQSIMNAYYTTSFVEPTTQDGVAVACMYGAHLACCGNPNLP